MEPNENFSKVDPDYEKYNLALKEIDGKETEDELTSERLYNIIAEEFDTELTYRQRQLEEIENKIFKAQKLLHLVRYVLIASYYNKRNLEYASTTEDSSSIFDAQNRIHPAVKKLLGTNKSLEALAVRGKRKVHNKNNATAEIVEDCQPPNIKKIKLKATTSNNLKSNQVISQSTVRRQKNKHRILIGNISKWMPSLENDNTTHKWMVYVRGPKEAPDLSHLIEKVIFYLHPSYKPHDVVEVNEYPFHLSRRGWGEFPLRVQIFFKCTSNKPVSIVHNLKLDKTYTGRQTLGNETVVDIFLYNNIPVKSESENIPDTSKTAFMDIKEEDTSSNNYSSFIKTELTEEEEIIDADIKEEYNSPSDDESEFPATSSFEHDYCHDEKPIKDEDAADEVSTDINVSLIDHSYSLPYSDCNDVLQTSGVQDKKCQEDTEKQGDNKLIFGLDNSYEELRDKSDSNLSKNKCFITTLTTASGQPIRVLPQSFNKVLLSNGSVVQIKVLRTPQSFMKKIEPSVFQQTLPDIVANTIDPTKHQVTFPGKLFKNIGEILPYLFRRLPLWHEMANDEEYKCCYPFVAKSMEEFLSWNNGKQINSEWNRARTIRKILHSKNFPEAEKWSTKAIFMYGRSHGYGILPFVTAIFKKPSLEKKLLGNCFSESLRNETDNDPIRNDENVDVIDNNDSFSTTTNVEVTNISDTSLRHHCTFVKEAAFDCGVMLKPERIGEGVVWNGAERMMLEAVKCLADHLIRRARHHQVCQEGDRETIEVSVGDIKIAMNERPEIKSIREYQKRRLMKDFFS